MKKLCSLLTCLAIFINMPFSALATSTSGSAEIPNERQNREFQSNLEYTSLLDSFWYDFNEEYPDYYAGAYLNSDGFLVVRAFELNDEIRLDIQHRTGNPEVLIEESSTSYNTLIRLKNSVTEYAANNPNSSISNNLVSSSIMDDNSTLEIGVEDDSSESTSLILSELFPTTRSVDLTSIVTFKKEERGNLTLPTKDDVPLIAPAAATTTMYSGDKITTSSGYMSIGFPCRMKTNSGGYVYGFVTSAHGCKPDEVIYYDNTAIGFVREWKLDGRVDCAFVQMTNRNFSLPQQIKLYNEETGQRKVYPVAISGGVSVAVGSSVYKDGATTNTTSGTVKSVDTDLYFNDIEKTMTNLIKTSAMTEPGDSGGLGFVIGTDASTLKTSAMKFGIVEGDYSILGIRTSSYFINSRYIYSDMPVYVYSLSDAPW